MSKNNPEQIPSSERRQKLYSRRVSVVAGVALAVSALLGACGLQRDANSSKIGKVDLSVTCSDGTAPKSVGPLLNPDPNYRDNDTLVYCPAGSVIDIGLSPNFLARNLVVSGEDLDLSDINFGETPDRNDRMAVRSLSGAVAVVEHSRTDKVELLALKKKPNPGQRVTVNSEVRDTEVLVPTKSQGRLIGEGILTGTIILAPSISLASIIGFVKHRRRQAKAIKNR